MKQNRSFQGGLRKWISGDIRAKEEAQLDQISQEDAFARDALDGLRSFADADHSQNINRLRQKLQKKEKPAVLIPIMLRRIAAAVLFLVALGTVWWLNQPSQTKNLSLDEASRPNTETSASSKEDQGMQEEAIAATEPKLIEEAAPTPAPKVNPPQKQTTPNPPITAPAQTEPIIAETIKAEEEILANEAPPEVLDLEKVATFRSKSTTENSAGQAPTSSLPQAYENLPIQTISGKVLDPTGQPVAGASIQNLTNQQQTITDLLGNFTMTQQVNSDSADLQISHFNYADTTMALEMDQGLEINLQDRSTSSSASNDSQQPYPLGGFAYFQEVTAPNRQKKSSENRASKMEVPVYAPSKVGTTIRFTVYAKGKLGNFKVLSSPDKKTERKALKKLRQGPKWVLPVGLDSLDTQITIPMRK